MAKILSPAGSRPGPLDPGKRPGPEGHYGRPTKAKTSGIWNRDL
jgi:hypothetical protein